MYLTIGINCWGLGETPQLSIKEALKHAPEWGCEGVGRRRKLRIYTLMSFNPEKTRDVYVDDMGRYCFTGEKPVLVEDVYDRPKKTPGVARTGCPCTR